MNPQINKIINTLDLLYYEYDHNKNIFIKDSNYTNKQTQLEFFKLTYHLTKHYIVFEVLDDKSIKLFKKQNFLSKNINKMVEFIRNRRKKIYLLNDKKVKWAKNIPLFTIQYTNDYISLDNYDALIFTSKNGIKAIDNINKQWKNIPAYVISEQSAKLVKDLNGKLEFISSKKHGNAFGYELIDKLKNKNVLYLRGEDIVSDILTIFRENNIKCDDKIIYKNCFNENLKNISIPKNAKIIFSSPSTIKYFFKKFKWDNSYTAISIGHTTAKYFPKDIKPIISTNTSLKACVDKALDL